MQKGMGPNGIWGGKLQEAEVGSTHTGTIRERVPRAPDMSPGLWGRQVLGGGSDRQHSHCEWLSIRAGHTGVWSPRNSSLESHMGFLGWRSPCWALL